MSDKRISELVELTSLAADDELVVVDADANGTKRITVSTINNDLVENTNFTTAAYRYVDTVYFTSSGTFTKGTYPWLRAVRVRLVGGGGSGASPADGGYGSAGGGGGAYAESFILESSLSASETVTIGAGGVSPSSTIGQSGQTGGTTSFGSLVSAAGGSGGVVDSFADDGGNGGNTGTGDLVIEGGGGGAGSRNAISGVEIAGKGGGTALSTGPASTSRISGSSAATRKSGVGFGTGGSGGSSGGSHSGNASGGDGQDGVVIVELYA